MSGLRRHRPKLARLRLRRIKGVISNFLNEEFSETNSFLYRKRAVGRLGYSSTNHVDSAENKFRPSLINLDKPRFISIDK